MQPSVRRGLFRMNAKTVLITGANRGLGLEFVKQFLKLPSPPTHLMAACRNPEGADELKSLQKAHSSLHIVQYDIGNDAHHVTVAEKVKDIVGDLGLNLLINNAGVATRTSLEQVCSESMLNDFKINCVGTLLAAQALCPLVEQAASSLSSQPMSCSKAAIINISSRMGSVADNTSGGMYSYRASKASLNIVSKSLSVDLRPKGILVATLHPGWVLTEMGSSKAPTSPEESIAGMMKIMGDLGENSEHVFYHFNGSIIPW